MNRPVAPVRGNLPSEPTSFVGRDRELAAVRDLVASGRLVTLVGPGGVGKTRLARRVATHLRACDGVWLVDVAAVGHTVGHVADPTGGSTADLDQPDPPSHRPDLQALAQAVLNALGVGYRFGAPPTDLLTAYLATRRRLVLLLDNCEALLLPAALLTRRLLPACAGLRILATSRDPLRIDGENRFVVQPLPVPDRSARAPGDLVATESVALFVARARAAVPEFQLTAANAAAVAAICHRLEGLPLALELAAARLRVQDPAGLLTLLSDRFAELGPAAPDAPARQRTLHACVDWSFQQCTAAEQRLWARLSVFVDGFELDAAEAVCADDEVPKDAVLDLLAGLVDKSVISTAVRGRAVRYLMLGAIRDFGRQQLRTSREEAVLRRRHRDWYRQLIECADADAD